MADINFTSGQNPATTGGGRLTEEREEQIVELIELLFFAYRDFVSDPDKILAQFGFGRAHHRVIHFVDRNPGLRVADLLDILNITKQSLARVLRQLIEEGFIYQREGTDDRRQRLLHLTAAGHDLARNLRQPQIERVREAMAVAGPEAEAQYREILYSLVNPRDRGRVRALVDGGSEPDRRPAATQE